AMGIAVGSPDRPGFRSFFSDRCIIPMCGAEFSSLPGGKWGCREPGGELPSADTGARSAENGLAATGIPADARQADLGTLRRGDVARPGVWPVVLRGLDDV